MAKISDRIARSTDFYRTDPAQVYMAAWILSHTYDKLVAIAPPAAGKTFVFLLVAARCLELDQTRAARVVIYVSSRIVANQIQEKLALFEKPWAVLVTDHWDTDAWLREKNNKIFIIDEAEDVI